MEVPKVARAHPGGKTVPTRLPENDAAPLRAAAEEFEAAFLAEALSHAGFDRALAGESGFGGEAMSGFYLAELSGAIAKRGDFGIADLIVKSEERRS
ncbi:MAG: rod-binding protein [Parvularculaceae bacterium]